jgi:hypothetical protein
MNGPFGIEPRACFYGLNFRNACGGTEAADVFCAGQKLHDNKCDSALQRFNEPFPMNGLLSGNGCSGRRGHAVAPANNVV